MIKKKLKELSNNVVNEEVECYGILAQNFYDKKVDTLLDHIIEMNGFIGVHPLPHNVLLVFESEEDAKIAMDNLEDLDVCFTSGVEQVFVEKNYVEDAKKKLASYKLKNGKENTHGAE